MAEGTIDILPEMEAVTEAMLPRGVTIVSRETYGGAIRMKIQGEGITDRPYQLVTTDEPMRKCIELKPGGPNA